MSCGACEKVVRLFSCKTDLFSWKKSRGMLVSRQFSTGLVIAASQVINWLVLTIT